MLYIYIFLLLFHFLSTRKLCLDKMKLIFVIKCKQYIVQISVRVYCLPFLKQKAPHLRLQIGGISAYFTHAYRPVVWFQNTRQVGSLTHGSGQFALTGPNQSSYIAKSKCMAPPCRGGGACVTL
jgi:hypothetical protein